MTLEAKENVARSAAGLVTFLRGTKQVDVGGIFKYAELRGSIKAVVCCFSNGHLDLQASEIMDTCQNNY